MSRLKLVQFMHPGPEHVPDLPDERSWNRSGHRRTFLRTLGISLRGAQIREGPLLFWGEWEPQARICASLPPAPGWPQYICEPFFDPPASYNLHQNTDPFVFGERFLYSNCLQHSDGRPNSLQDLARGSVILFGSRLAGHFVVDTVFVIAGSMPHEAGTAETALRGQVPDVFFNVVLRPLYQSMQANGWDQQGGRLYFGATPEDPVEGMYSYFPAADASEAPDGFPRPNIQLEGCIDQNRSRWWAGNPIGSLSTMHDLWQTITDQVLAASPNIRLGVRAALPPRASAALADKLGEPQSCVRPPRRRRPVC